MTSIARGSSKGRTQGFGPWYGGSNPPPRARYYTMKISTEDVKHVAKLARLRFTDEEITPFTKQFNDILEYFTKLKDIDTSRIDPSTHAVTITNVYREDAVKGSISKEQALKNAPDAENGYYKVPKIIKV